MGVMVVNSMLVGLAGVHWPYHVLILLSCCP